MSTDENTPMDAVAMTAEAIVKAALEWRWTQDEGDRMNHAEWKLFEACNAYGERYRGVVGR